MTARAGDRPGPAGRTGAAVVVGVAVALLVLAAVTVARPTGEDDAAMEPGPAGGEPPGPPPAEETPPASHETPPPAARTAPEVVTEDDDGATVALAPGDATALRLSNDWVWEEPRASGAAVTLATVDYFADPGYAEWHVEAVAAGISEVNVAGSPDCPDEADCPPRSVTIRFEVSDA